MASSYESMMKDLKDNDSQQFDKLMNQIGVSPNDTPRSNNNNTSATGAAARGLANGASFGLADEVLDGLNKIYSGIPNGDSLRGLEQADQQQHPYASDAGNVVGGIVDSLIPGLGEAKLASLLGQGALSGIGNSNTLTDKTKTWGDTALSGGEGAATNAILGSAIKALGTGIVNKQTIGRLINSNPLEMADNSYIGNMLRNSMGTTSDGRNLAQRYADNRLAQFNQDIDQFRKPATGNNDVQSDINTILSNYEGDVPNDTLKYTNNYLKDFVGNDDNLRNNITNSDFNKYIQGNANNVNNVVNRAKDINNMNGNAPVDINKGELSAILGTTLGHPALGALAAVLQSGIAKNVKDSILGGYARKVVNQDLTRQARDPNLISRTITEVTPAVVNGTNALVVNRENQTSPPLSNDDLHTTLSNMGFTNEDLSKLR